MQLSIKLLGLFEADVDGVPAQSFYSDKVRALLAYLALETGQPHARTTLAGLLWPEQPDNKARQSLRQALFRLQKAIDNDVAEPKFLLVSRSDVQLNLASPVTIDVATFLEKLKGIDLANELNADEAILVREAVDLYRDDLLAQFYLPDCNVFEEWALMRREALRQLALSALRATVVNAMHHGNFELARQYAQRWLDIEPWQEAAHRQMMRILFAMGDQSAALNQYELCCRLLIEELGVEPTEETTAIFNEMRLAGSGTGRSKLPAQFTQFVGRTAELALLRQRLADPNVRLLTIVGPGGMGKTRLAIEAATQTHNLLHGAFFVALAGVDSLDLMLSAVADAVDFTFESQTGLRAQLFSFLRDKELLLICDNFETLLEGPYQQDARQFISDLLNEAVQVNVLTTSRVRLKLRAEWVLPLEGLGFPSTPEMESHVFQAIGHLDFDDLQKQYTALQLFAENSIRIQPDFELAPSNIADVVRVCELAEGLPLAIELATAWLSALTVAEIATEIERSIDVLATQETDVPDRHQSVRAVCNYSVDTLTPRERDIFYRVAVFSGGFDRQAAQDVTGASVMNLATLLDRSLLRRTISGRYAVHNLLRQFAVEALLHDPDGQVTLDAHADYYAGWLETAARPFVIGGEQRQALDGINIEIDNIIAAWRHHVARGDVDGLARMTDGMFHFYDTRSRFSEGEAQFGAAVVALPAGSDPKTEIVRARILARQGWFNFHGDDIALARQRLSDSLTVLRVHDAHSETVFNLNYLGALARHENQYPEARRYLSEALVLARDNHNDLGASVALNILGQVDSLEGDLEMARGQLRESLAIKRRIGDQWGMTFSLTYLGRIEHANDNLDEARRLFEESLTISRQLKDRRGMAFVNYNLGNVQRDLGERTKANHYFDEGLRMYRRIGSGQMMSLSLTKLGELAIEADKRQVAAAYLQDALETAISASSIPAMVDGMLGLAELESAQGPTADTLSMLASIQTYGSVSLGQRQRTLHLYDRISTQIDVPEDSIQVASAASLIALSRAVVERITI